MGSVLDVARCEELSLLRRTWRSLDRFLNVRDARDRAAEFLEGTLLSHEQTFEPALQQVSHALMATIEPLGVGAMEPAQAATKIRLGRFKHQVIVIAHQTGHGAAPVLLLHLATEYTENWCRSPSSRKMGCCALPRAVMMW
ncbi:MAG: hypothetical protein AAB308_10690 [Nitrospirota bacterium]